MGQLGKASFVLALLVALPLTAEAKAATFDGEWSVRIASSSSQCGDGVTLSIGISNGRIASSETSVRASGHVAEAGIVSVTLSSGIKRAVGYGHLSGSSGSGTWRGTMCSGTWTAQKV
jgi:hypothetical protein